MLHIYIIAIQQVDVDTRKQKYIQKTYLENLVIEKKQTTTKQTKDIQHKTYYTFDWVVDLHVNF